MHNDNCRKVKGISYKALLHCYVTQHLKTVWIKTTVYSVFTVLCACWVVLVSPGFTHVSVIQLKDFSGWHVQDGITHISGTWCWLNMEALLSVVFYDMGVPRQHSRRVKVEAIRLLTALEIMS